MGTLLDLASLVVVPSGYKEDKIYSVVPTDGSGDLDFTRASSATRVNSAGLIEKVRTNHILQSNSFDTTWLATDATITSGATDPNGGATAWTLANTANNGIIQQAATLTGLRSVSIFAKQGTHRYLLIGAYGGTNSYQSFDLQTGTITNGSNGRIENVGGGWYRCTSFGADGTTGGVQIFPSNISNGAATSTGSILIYQCQYESGDIPTDYIPTTTAAVSVGMTANVPRLDYSGGGCPKLLLEPQRTNLVEYSEQADNSYWNKGGVTILSNATISPSGYLDADKLQEDSSTGTHRYGKSNFPGGTQRTFSVFAKKGERNYVSLFDNNTISPEFKGVIFNLNTGTLSLNNNPSYYINPTITDYGNGWYRCSATWTPISISVPSVGVSADGLTNSYAGTTGSGIFVWGAQIEAGSYPTSYIPTLGTSVTRVADACSKTGISSLIGQTEGTMFVEASLSHSSVSNGYLAQVRGNNANRFFIFRNGGTNKLGCYALVNGTEIYTTLTPTASTGTIKAAFAYKSGDLAFYINGVQIGTSSATYSISTALTEFFIDQNNATENGYFDYKQTLLFKTRLSNTELAQLTTL